MSRWNKICWSVAAVVVWSGAAVGVADVVLKIQDLSRPPSVSDEFLCPRPPPVSESTDAPLRPTAPAEPCEKVCRAGWVLDGVLVECTDGILLCGGSTSRGHPLVTVPCALMPDGACIDAEGSR